MMKVNSGVKKNLNTDSAAGQHTKKIIEKPDGGNYIDGG
jgi:hypothetical protein